MKDLDHVGACRPPGMRAAPMATAMPPNISRRAAVIESDEETGYEARSFEYLGKFCPDGNRGFGQAHFFLARGEHARTQ